MVDPAQNEKVPSYIRPAEFLYETPPPPVSETIEKSTRPARFACPKCTRQFEEFLVGCPDDGAALEVIDTLIRTTFAGRYQILELLGRGGMSTVYKAQHLFMNTTVAVKILHSHLEVQSQTVRRFQQEAKAAGALSHPCIVSVHDFGLTDDGRMFLIMDCVEGKSLATEIKERGLIPVAELTSWILDVLEGLEHAHEKGVVHRDLKPGNIVIAADKDGIKKPKIVDFGIAKLTSGDQHLTTTGEIFGSPLYMSPEQCQGQMLDGRSDVYSMGCVMYEALTGATPFFGESALLTMNKQISSSPDSMRTRQPDIPIWLNEVVLKALEKDPKNRFQSAHAFRESLLDGQNRGTTAKLTGYQALVSRTARRSRKLFRTLQLHTLTVIATISTLAVIVAVAYQTNESFKKAIDYPIRNLHYSLNYDAAERDLAGGKPRQAAEKFETAFQFANTRPQENRALEKMAGAYDQLGDYLKADTVRRRKLELRKRFVAEGLGMSDAEFSSSKNRLAEMPEPKNAEQAKYLAELMRSEAVVALNNQGDFEFARRLYERALSFREKWVPDEHEKILDLRISIGVALAMDRKVDEAEEQWNSANNYMNQHHIPLCSGHVYIPQNLARVQQLKKNYHQAKNLFLEGLNNAKQLKGMDGLLKRAYEEYLGFLRATNDKDLSAIEAEYKQRFPNARKSVR